MKRRSGSRVLHLLSRRAVGPSSRPEAGSTPAAGYRNGYSRRDPHVVGSAVSKPSRHNRHRDEQSICGCLPVIGLRLQGSVYRGNGTGLGKMSSPRGGNTHTGRRGVLGRMARMYPGCNSSPSHTRRWRGANSRGAATVANDGRHALVLTVFDTSGGAAPRFLGGGNE